MKLALLFDHFGPYHLARLRAASARAEVVGVEFHGRSRDYAWDREEHRELQIDTVMADFGTGVATAQFREHLFRHLDACTPDVVAVPGWGSKEALAALDWCLRQRVPAILMSESSAHDEPRHWLKEWLKQRVVRLFDAALVGGTAHAAYLRHLGMANDRMFLGYDAVDNAHFEFPLPVPDSERQGFLASARFVEKKNLVGMLRAYAGYREVAGAGAWPLTLLGDGPLRPQLEGLSTELGLQKWVSLPGFKQYDELPGYYANSRAFIHASTTEQWGLVVNEAMAAGLPVLVSERCGCAADLVVEGRNGFLFNPFNIGAMMETMVKTAALPEDRRKAMGQESKAMIASWGPERFSSGLDEAAVCALEAAPRKPALADKLLLKLLMRR